MFRIKGIEIKKSAVAVIILMIIFVAFFYFFAQNIESKKASSIRNPTKSDIEYQQLELLLSEDKALLTETLREIYISGLGTEIYSELSKLLNGIPSDADTALMISQIRESNKLVEELCKRIKQNSEVLNDYQ